MNLRHSVAFALAVCCPLILPTWCVAGQALADSCSRQVSAQQALDAGMSKARAYGYNPGAMFVELKGPMHWQSLASSSQAGALHHEILEQWKSDLIDHCLWSFFLGCEPAHTTKDGGFEGCLDYPPELWVLIDSASGKILHSVRRTGYDARQHIDD